MKTTQDWHDEAGILTCSVSHELLDEKGRDVGALATITVGLTGQHLVKVYATRDGKGYGASFPKTHVCESVEKARVKAAILFAEQGRRYAKKFGTK